MDEDIVLLDHGEGGAATSRLVKDVFLRHLGGPEIPEDATEVKGAERIALTTDAFIVKPLEFAGGDIGSLAISGTVNDLAVMGAQPRYIAASFIIEEGFRIDLLTKLVISMARTATTSGVHIVAGDTKVVPAGEADGLFITTTGIGVIPKTRYLSSSFCRAGDVVLLSGPVGDHGIAVMAARGDLGLSGEFRSDCQPLADLAATLLRASPGTRCMRDPTRGGLATALDEIALASRVGIVITESLIPVSRAVRSACAILGLDPLYVACEGRLIAVVPRNEAEAALEAIRDHERAREASFIGEVTGEFDGVALETSTGGLRPLHALEGAQLPRIC